MRISDWSSDVCSSDLHVPACQGIQQSRLAGIGWPSEHNPNSIPQALRRRMRLFSDNLRQESFEEQCDLLYRSFRNVILIRKIKLGFHQRGNAEQVNFPNRSEEHTSELQSLMRISYAVFCLKKTHRYTDKR